MTVLRQQSFRFAVVGILSNVVLYFLYLFLTWVNLRPSIAVSIVYIVGAFQTFAFNSTWTFSKSGRDFAYLTRYLTAYIGAYLVNLLIIYVLVDQLAFPHHVVQAGTVLIIGALLFLGQRYWVFSG